MKLTPRILGRYLWSGDGALLAFWVAMSATWFETSITDAVHGQLRWSKPVWVLLCVLNTFFAWRRIHHKWELETRKANGLCLFCGYDLRASKGVCPECGKEQKLPDTTPVKFQKPARTPSMILAQLKREIYDSFWKDVPLRPKTTAYIALGANLGDRSTTLREALVRLDATKGITVKAVSSFLENPAVGGPADSPAFLNAAAEVTTTLSAPALLARMLEIEKSLGRERREKWGPRTIDLDILIYGNSIIHNENLIVPHPRLHERRFVLQPLAELAPGLVVPGIGETVAALLARC